MQKYDKNDCDQTKGTANFKTLNSLAIFIEFSTKGDVLKVNDNALTAFGYTKKEIKEKNHSDLCHNQHYPYDKTRDIWQDLQNDKIFSDKISLISANGTPFSLEAMYVPIFSKDKKLDKVMFFALEHDFLSRNESSKKFDDTPFSRILDSSDNAVMLTSPEGKITYVNKGFTSMYGYTSDEAIGKSPTFIFNSNHSKLLEKIETLHAIHQPFKIEGKTYPKKDYHHVYWTSIVSKPIFDCKNKHQSTVIFLADTSYHKLQMLLNSKVLEVLDQDLPQTEVFTLICNEVERIFPEFTFAIIIFSTDILSSVFAPSLPSLCKKRIEGKNLQSCYPASKVIRSKKSFLIPSIDEDLAWKKGKEDFLKVGFRSAWATPIKDPSEGAVVGASVFYSRNKIQVTPFLEKLSEIISSISMTIIKKETRTTAIHKLKFYDPITDLPNRASLIANTRKLLKKMNSLSLPLVVMVINIDKFRQVNESLGHNSGNILLRIISRRITKELRRSSVVGHLAKDEFIVILPDCSNTAAVEIIKNLQQTISKPCYIDGLTITPTVSIGISVFPDHGSDMETLIHNASLAMSHAKKKGPNVYFFFSKKINQEIIEKFSMESYLSKAVANNELQLFFQPQVNLQTKEIHGTEALCRWISPKFGFVMPGKFIPLAEESGIIESIGNWTITETCQQIKKWKDEGLDIPCVSINLSPINFYDTELSSYIENCLKKNQISPQDLIVELTESVILGAAPATFKNINDLTKMGVRLSIDDFGTGYASLSYLHTLPIKEIKLDQGFVRDMPNNEISLRLGHAVAQLGESLNLTLVAEGVETEEQAGMLSILGYHIGQGYYFSEPLPPKNFAKWVREYRNKKVKIT